MIAEVGDMRERQRQQDRDAVGAAEAGQHADDDAEHDADEHDQEVERLEDDAEAVKQIGDFFHLMNLVTPTGRPSPRPASKSEQFLDQPLRQRHQEPFFEDDEGHHRHAHRDRGDHAPAVAAEPSHETRQ